MLRPKARKPKKTPRPKWRCSIPSLGVATGLPGRVPVADARRASGARGAKARPRVARAANPAVEAARAEGIDARGPLPADTVFAQAQRGAYRWVLALYHDQGLVAVKTATFGEATNWTLGLPYLRTSVDHGTAYDIAGKGVADTGSLRAVIEETLGLLG